MSDIICPWEPAKFLFYSTDPGIPTLLYYAYVPMMVLALFFAVFIFI